MAWILALVGMIIGIVGGGGLAALSLAVSGFVLGTVFKYKRQVEKLSIELQDLRARLPLAKTTKSEHEQKTDLETPKDDQVESIQPVTTRSSETRRPSRLNQNFIEPQSETAAESSGWAEEQDKLPGNSALASPRKPNAINEAINALINFFITGNVVLKAGVVVLFIGVGFLLKFAADNSLLPIELRLSSTALAAVGLLIFGWKLRLRKAAYALTVQGAAMGILYMTVFASASLYSLLPLGFAFVFMFALVAFTCMLSVL